MAASYKRPSSDMAPCGQMCTQSLQSRFIRDMPEGLLSFLHDLRSLTWGRLFLPLRPKAPFTCIVNKRQQPLCMVTLLGNQWPLFSRSRMIGSKPKSPRTTPGGPDSMSTGSGTSAISSRFRIWRAAVG